MAAYQYTPLNTSNGEFRLIKLWPGSLDDRIEISIFHTPLGGPAETSPSKRMNLEELRRTLPQGWEVFESLEGQYLFERSNDGMTCWTHPDPSVDCACYEKATDEIHDGEQYEALSYVWGAPEPSVKIHIRPDTGPNPGWTTMQIGPSLSSALRRFRGDQDPRVLWVDALCISQADILERNNQVKRMETVYSLANRVLIWLGDESYDSKHAVETLNYLAQQAVFDKGFLIMCPDANHRNWFRPATSLPYKTTTWSSIHSLLCRPWFLRTWVLQEAQLAETKATLFCGDDQILWTRFQTCLVIIFGKQSNLPSQMYFRTKQLLPGIFHEQSFLSLIKWARNQQCTDPRDRVYGVLGLCTSKFNERLKPDYNQEVWDVYRTAALAHISATNSLQILTHCNIDTSFPRAPSWTPNWNDAGGRSHQEDVAWATWNADARLMCEATDVVLRAHGKRCAEVSSVCDRITGEYANILATVSIWERLAVDNSGLYVTGDDVFDAFMLLISKGRVRERWYFGSMLSLEELKDAYRRQTIGDIDDVVFSNLISRLGGSCFFMTHEGYFGLSALALQAGDQVHVLLGCDSPILLRPTGTGSYRVVGECYVQGLQDGEGILGPICQPWVSKFYRDEARNWQLGFRNSQSGEVVCDDPRLPPLPSSWTLDGPEIQPDVPYHCREFRNIETDEKIRSDPRMLPDALRERGVDIREILLV